jgi:ATP-binding cassette, subfamily B, bacterial PglK
MPSGFERYRGLIQPGTAWQWGLVLALALTVSGLEAAGAVLIYVLVGLATDPDGAIELPVLGDLRDLALGFSSEELVVITAAGVGIFFLLRGVMVLVQAYYQTWVATSAGVHLATRLLTTYLRLPYSFHLRRNSAQLIRNANESVNEILNEVFMPSVRLVSDTMLVLGLTVVLVVTAPLASAIAAATVAPVVFVTMGIVQPRVGRQGAIDQHERGRSIQLLQQSLHGFRDITVLGRQPHFVAAYNRSRRVIASTRNRRAVLSALPRVVIEVVAVGLVAVFVVTATLAGEGRGSLAVIGLFAYASLRIMPALNKILKNFNDIRFGRAALDDVQADLRRPVPSPPADTRPLPFRDRVVVENVSFTYDGNDGPTLDRINLEIPRGRSLGIVGATGAGKSTLVDLLIGLSTPTTGRITIDGVDLRGNESAWHRQLGMVSQEVFLLDDTLRRNIALGLCDNEIDDARIDHAVRLAQLEDFVSSLPEGLETWVGERGMRVSGGQRQRIAIARALYPRPDVLILDEGTSALDNLTEAALIEALAGLHEDYTIITIAHRLSSVEDHDNIVFLHNGRIEAMGTFNELIDRSVAFQRMAKPASASESS